MTATIKKLWKNEYFKTAVMVILIVVVVFGFWYGTQLALNTEHPALAVASGSMCQVEYMRCDGWTHPFEHTLHIGDLIIVQGVDPKDIKAAAYPEGDIIVFHKPRSNAADADELIVHRAIANVTREDNGLIYFRTRGDGSPSPSGDQWSWDYRGENYSWSGMVSEKLLVGKVVLRVPWIGHVALFMHNSSGMLIIIVLLIILVVTEFVIPAFTRKEAKIEEKEGVEKAFEDKAL